MQLVLNVLYLSLSLAGVLATLYAPTNNTVFAATTQTNLDIGMSNSPNPGYSDLKEIVKRALDSDENYNLLFIGPPASSKTLFLIEIMEIRKDGVNLVATNKILDILEHC